MRTFANPQEMLAAKGEELGPSEWLVIDQERIDRFAEATDDHQWIHVDAERAAQGPYGRTIAHGYLTVTLVPRLMRDLYRIESGLALGLNYGLNKVRLPAPVPVDARIRATAVITDAAEVTGGVQVTMTTTVEIEGSEKPACVVESIVRLMSS